MVGQRPVQMNLEPSRHTCKTQSPAVKSDTAKLSEPEGLPASLATESGEASLPSTRLQAAEKPLKRLIQTLQSPALQIWRQLTYLGQLVSANRQRLALIDVGARLASLPITVDTFLKRRVV